MLFTSDTFYSFTMNITVESISNKWQPPSVLHLLPFSKNNAGTAYSNIVTSHSNQQASYTQNVNKSSGLPNLSSSQQGKDKPRSKSAVVMEHKLQIGLQKQQQQQRLFRASSERLSRSPKKPAKGRDFIERARSEYVVRSDRKLTQDVVTFAIKDINEQILGQTSQNENKSLTLDSNSSPENGRYRIKPLLKPVVKLKEGKWPQSSARFWRSSMISPGERELQRHKTSLDAQLYALKRSKMVKLNVKDLPRSQTPIGENDPDKLNMKQVIAFLQSSGDVREVNDGVTNDKHIIDSSHYIKKDKQEHSKDKGKVTDHKENAAALLIAAKSRRKEESSGTSCEISKTGPTSSIQTHLNSKHFVAKTDNINNLNPISSHRPNSYSGESPCKPTEDVKNNQYTIDNNQRNPRPELLQCISDNTEFRIPAGIRHIRESTIENRPFRLHRFLTLVSNSPENKAVPTQKVSNRLNPSNTRFTSSSANNNSNQSSANGDKEKDCENLNKTFTDPKGFFLTQNGPTDNEYERKDKVIRRYKGQRLSQQTITNSDDSIGNGEIICLPTVPVDIESDDDSNFISLPTVPSKSTRKDLVLSAHGRAMQTKNFPALESSQKAVIRPHSEKLTLNRRLEINGDVRTQPSEVRASDLVEWGGVKNPEKIFLADDDSSAKRSSDASNTTLNLTNNGTVNGELSSNGLKEGQDLEPSSSGRFNSPSRSKTSDDVITFPSENHSSDACSNNSKEAVVGKCMGKNGSGAKPKLERVSSPLSDPVRLTLRKERNLTREKTYMVDMESTGNDLFGL